MQFFFSIFVSLDQTLTRLCLGLEQHIPASWRIFHPVSYRKILTGTQMSDKIAGSRKIWTFKKGNPSEKKNKLLQLGDLEYSYRAPSAITKALPRGHREVTRGFTHSYLSDYVAAHIARDVTCDYRCIVSSSKERGTRNGQKGEWVWAQSGCFDQTLYLRWLTFHPTVPVQLWPNDTSWFYF